MASTAAHAANAPAATCTTHVASDFNGDGLADVAVGEPGRTVGGQGDAGAVRIEYGSLTGLDATTQQYFDQNSSGIVGAPTMEDDFSFALASGYFNDDCFADLAIGTPGENDVTILYGSAAGLGTAGASQYHGNQSGIGFGASLTAGDFNNDGFDDLVAGAPDATDVKSDSGEIGIMAGSASGVQAPTWMNQSTAGMPGTAESADEFGTSVAAGDFTGDGVTDLAIGTPLEDNGSIADGGSVAVIKGSAGGLVTTGAQLWTQTSTGVPGTDEKGDQFGSALAAGDVNGDGKADLVVGVPFEAIGSVKQAGDIVYLRGASAGVTGTGSLSFSQSTSGISGTVATGDIFGFSVAVGDFSGKADGTHEIAIGTPNDMVSGAAGGSVTVLANTVSGPTGTGSHIFSQTTAGVAGTAEDGDGFGWAIAAAYTHGGANADLVVGVPFETSGTTTANGTVSVLPGVSGTGLLTGTGSLTFAESATLGGPLTGDVFGFSIA